MSKLLKLSAVLLVLAAAAMFLLRLRPHPQAPPPATPDAASAAVSPDAHAQPAPAPPARLESAQDGLPRSPAADAAHEGLARVHLRLVDEETREPLPFAAAELHDKAEVLERIESDARGLLEGKAFFPPGDYLLDLSSERHAGDLIQTRAKEARALQPTRPLALAPAAADAPAADFAVPAGPTFLFEASWPRGLSPASFTAVLSGADPRLAFDKLFAPLQEGKPAWARFSPLARFLGGGPPYSLRVSSEDALWLASASVDKLAGRATAPIELVFEPRARLVGRVLDPDGKPVANEWLQAWAPGASFESRTRRPLLTTTRDDGGFDLRAAEPGRYTLKLEGKGFLPYSEEVELPALTRVEHVVRLARPDPAQLAPIRGRVRSQSGRYEERLMVLLVPEAPPKNGQTAYVEWSGEEGAKSGSFEFKDLVPGEYTLDLRPVDLVAVEPRKLVARPSAQPLEFLVKDSGPRAELRVRVLADEDGSPLRAFRLTANVQGGEERTTLVLRTGENEALLRGAPVGATLELRAEMQGRQMLWTSVVVAEQPEPLVLRLKQGWGAELSVQGPKLEPLAGAKVYLDEELAGVADEKGVVRAALARVPQKCRVEYRDWKLAPGGEVSPDTGQFRAWQPWVQVRMEPPK